MDYKAIRATAVTLLKKMKTKVMASKMAVLKVTKIMADQLIKAMPTKVMAY